MITHRLGRYTWLPLLLLLAGCHTAQVQFVPLGQQAAEGRPGKDVEVLGHLFANSWGVNAFGALPCFAGDINRHGKPSLSLFQNTATIKTAIALIEAEARRQGATHLIDLDSEWVSNYYVATFIFSVLEGGASATAVRIVGDASVHCPEAIPLSPAKE